MKPCLIIKFWQSCGGKKRHYLAYVRWLGRDWLVFDGVVPTLAATPKARDEAA